MNDEDKKEQKRAYRREHYRLHRERTLKERYTYYRENKEKIRDYNKSYYLNVRKKNPTSTETDS